MAFWVTTATRLEIIVSWDFLEGLFPLRIKSPIASTKFNFEACLLACLSRSSSHRFVLSIWMKLYGELTELTNLSSIAVDKEQKPLRTWRQKTYTVFL